MNQHDKLMESMQATQQSLPQCRAEINRLAKINAELLAALEVAADRLKKDVDFHQNEMLREAITNAKKGA